MSKLELKSELQLETIYADRFIRKIAFTNSDARMCARTVYTSNTDEWSFAARDSGIDIWEETLRLPDKAYDVFNPYDNPCNNCYQFKSYKDAVEYAFGSEYYEEIIKFMEDESEGVL